MRGSLILLAGMAFSTANALAAPPLESVDNLGPPAWLERGGRRLPLAVGMALAAGDTVETGAAGRATLNLAGGNRAQLGMGSRLILAQSLLSVDQDAWFELKAGALRLVVAGRDAPNQRPVRVSLGNISVTLRTADIWGRVTAQEAQICVLAGRAEVQHPMRGAVMLDQPPSCMTSPASGEPHPVAPADPERLKAWLADLERPAGSVRIQRGGAWMVQLAALKDPDIAQGLVQHLAQAGYAPAVPSHQARGRTYYRVRITDIDTQAEARALAQRLGRKFAIKSPWVGLNSNGMATH